MRRAIAAMTSGRIVHCSRGRDSNSTSFDFRFGGMNDFGETSNPDADNRTIRDEVKLGVLLTVHARQVLKDETAPSQDCLLKRGRCGTMTHDYKRHGTTTLFAALNTIDGSVPSTCMRRHRHAEWLRFQMGERSVPKDKDIHIIADTSWTIAN